MGCNHRAHFGIHTCTHDMGAVLRLENTICTARNTLHVMSPVYLTGRSCASPPPSVDLDVQ